MLNFTAKRFQKLAGLLTEQNYEEGDDSDMHWRDLVGELRQLKWPRHALIGGEPWMASTLKRDLDNGELNSGKLRWELEDIDYGDDYIELTLNPDGTFDGHFEINIGGNMAQTHGPVEKYGSQMDPVETAEFMRRTALHGE